ncbi:hypothetical protein MTO96_011594 [Rhipicephalus appendiculatus]
MSAAVTGRRQLRHNVVRAEDARRAFCLKTYERGAHFDCRARGDIPPAAASGSSAIWCADWSPIPVSISQAHVRAVLLLQARLEFSNPENRDLFAREKRCRPRREQREARSRVF